MRVFIFILCTFTAYAWAQGFEKPERLASTSDTYRSLLIQAILADPWFERNQLIQASNLELAESLDVWDNPKLSLELANMPVGSWDFGQEPMTQLAVGVSQRMPRGNSTQIKAQLQGLQNAVLESEAALRVLAISKRLALILNQLSGIQGKLDINHQQLALLNELKQTLELAYQDVNARVSQSQIIAIALAQAELEDKNISLKLRLAENINTLDTLLHDDKSSPLSESHLSPPDVLMASLELNASPRLLDRDLNRDSDYYQAVTLHPMVGQVDASKNIAQERVALADQAFKPMYGISARYGYRDDDPLNRSRDDFFSIGVNIDIPLFNEKANNSERQAYVLQSNAIETQRRLTIRELGNQLKVNYRTFQDLSAQLQQLETQLLKSAVDYEQSVLLDYANQSAAIMDVIQAIKTRLQVEERILDQRITIANLCAEIDYLLSTEAMAKQFIQSIHSGESR